MDFESDIDIYVTWSSILGVGKKFINLINEGTTGVRLITKGFEPEILKSTVDQIATIGKSLKQGFQLMIDLPGLKPFLSRTINSISLKAGDRIELSCDKKVTRDNILPTEYLDLYLKKILVGHKILVADGAAILEVENINPNGVQCLVLKGCILTGGRSINLPDSNVDYKSFTKKDMTNLEILKGANIDSISISFVDNAKKVRTVRDYARKLGMNYPIISKIESEQGITNLEEIVKESDEIMIARGDLGIELPIERLGFLQNYILNIGKSFDKSVILATGILSSLTNSNSPSIAEVSDLTSMFQAGIRKFLLGDIIAVQNPILAVMWLKRIYFEWQKQTMEV